MLSVYEAHSNRKKKFAEIHLVPRKQHFTPISDLIYLCLHQQM